MRVYARQLQEHLPYLRRYARALTASTVDGDELVTQCVEAAMMAPTRFGLPDGARMPLYALLHLLFDAEGQGRPRPSPHPIERALALLPEVERRLYLLTALEGLTPGEAAQVLSIAPTEAAAALDHARICLRDALTARVLVVEDNPVIALQLETMVGAMGHTVCGTAATEREALEMVETRKPTLALLDLRLADGSSGISVARKLREGFALRVIFVTGAEGDLERLKLTQLGPVVRKPFTAETIGAAIARTIFMPRPVAFA